MQFHENNPGLTLTLTYNPQKKVLWVKLTLNTISIPLYRAV